MKSLVDAVLITAVSLLLQPAVVVATEEATAATADPMAPFQRLVGGRWTLQNSYHEFSWGLDRKSVHTRTYFLVEGRPKLASEGFWYWHPGEKTIKAFAHAVDMPVTFFDYTTDFEGDRMESTLRTYDAAGREETYIEVWEFSGEDTYHWTLLQDTAEGRQEIMTGTYVRSRP